MNHKSYWSCLALALLPACGNNTDAPEMTYGPLLNVLGEQLILPEHRAFVTESDALVGALQALSDAPSADTLSAAESAWRDARKGYRMLDAVQIGPDYDSHIADRIDVAPVDAAGIEALVSGSGALDDSAVGNAGGRKKGFLGLEYLLFSDPAGSDPAPALADDDAAPRRRSLAISIADEIAKSARDLDAGWEVDQDAFITQLETAGAGSQTYSSQRAAVDVLVNGVDFALEEIVGIALAYPLGRHNNGAPDFSKDPTQRSDNAVADMQSTLAGVTAVYSGTGFSSIMKTKSQKLDQTLLDELTSSQAALDAIPLPFVSAVTDDKSVVQAAYDATRALKNTWGQDAASILGATLKSDNDGD
jgi:predicted lipoprotein